MESTLPENTDKTIVCFKYIKVEMLAGKKPEFENASKRIFLFFPYRYIKAQGESALISQAKSK